jgi:hypothetical protein
LGRVLGSAGTLTTGNVAAWVGKLELGRVGAERLTLEGRVVGRDGRRGKLMRLKGG